MDEDIDIARFDKLIEGARQKFRDALKETPNLFGGPGNLRIDLTIAAGATLGSLKVPDGIDVNTASGLMSRIDLTLLNKAAPLSEVENIARRAKAEGSATVCVYPEHVSIVQEITGGNPPPIAVVGFPSVVAPSVSVIESTVFETCSAIQSGAREIDMVLPLNFKDGAPDYDAHYNYIRRIVVEAAQSDCPVKVILETAYLTDEQKVEACLIAKMAGAQFVKTSTGFAQDELMRPELPKTQKGATPYDVALMRRTVGDMTLDESGKAVPMGVKASGGVRSRNQAIAMYSAGASRIGASGGINVADTVAIKPHKEPGPY